MDGEAELRRNWEFAATFKLLNLLSIPLSFSAPDPDELEQALLNPSQHIPLLANLHGRLLGLSAGASSAKKWLTATSRFIAKRPVDFDHILAREQDHQAVKHEPTAVTTRDPRVKAEAGPSDQNSAQIHDPSSPAVHFPREEMEYLRLGSITRLLILHTIAELVVSQHESLLAAGSIADIPPHQMRYAHFATDAVGNKYWYFDDGRRVYREPGTKVFKTRLQQAEEDSAAAEKAAQEFAAEQKRLAEQQQKREAARLKDEARRKRQEKKRKSMEKWAPRVAATRTTRASRRAEQTLLDNARNSTSREERSTPVTDTAPYTDIRRSVESEVRQAQTLESTFQAESTRGNAGPSHRLTQRRSRENGPTSAASGETPVPARTRKRPRKGSNFEDATLRDCDGWETLCVNEESLREVLRRFQPDMVTILPSENVLVRSMEEEILPEFEAQEAKIRKEHERLEKKRRNDLLVVSTKRSSRVQALEQKREEAARKAAAEREKERELQNRKADFTEFVRNQITSLEKDLSKEIRNARRAYGITDAINRDEQLHQGFARKAARASRSEAAAIRRSARVVRNSQRSSLTEDERSASRTRNLRRSSRRRTFSEAASYSPQGGSRDANTPEPVGDPDHFDESRAKPTAIDDTTDGMSTSLEAPKAPPPASVGKKTVRDVQNGGDGTNSENHPQSEDSIDARENKEAFTSGLQEPLISKFYTWMTNPDDGEPIRVLDKFFFALKPNFEDAPLEQVDNTDLHVTGLGILVPPFGSDAEAVRVEIDKIDEWVIEYGTEPKLWAKTTKAWYELKEPAVEYQTAFASTRRKYELCIRVAILGATYKTADLTYSSIVDLLRLRYNEMQAFSESQVVAEKRFIISQMESVGTRALLQSGFIRELRKRIRQEDEQSTRAKSSRKGPGQRDEQNGDSRRAEEVPSKPGSRARRRSVVSGRQVVPRAVSSIINSVLRAATKSHTTSRKRKQNSDTNDVSGQSLDRSPKRMKRSSQEEEFVLVPSVAETPSTIDGRTEENRKHLIHVPREVENFDSKAEFRPPKTEVTGTQRSTLKDDAEKPSMEDASVKPQLLGPQNGKGLPNNRVVSNLTAKELSRSYREKSSQQESTPRKEEENSSEDDVVMSDVKTLTERHADCLSKKVESPFRLGPDDGMVQRTLSSCAMTDISKGRISNGQEAPATGAHDVTDGARAVEGSNGGS